MVLERKVAGVPVLWWVAGAVALLLAFGLVVESVVTWRGIATTRARVSTLEAALEEARSEASRLQSRLSTVSTEGGRVEEDLQGRIDQEVAALEDALAGQAEEDVALQRQVLLLKASGKALRARIHLSERDAGLAKRDLRECEDILTQAMDLAEGEIEVSLEELRTLIAEVRDSIEAQTFPVTTVEVLIERIEALVEP